MQNLFSYFLPLFLSSVSFLCFFPLLSFFFFSSSSFLLFFFFFFLFFLSSVSQHRACPTCRTSIEDDGVRNFLAESLSIRLRKAGKHLDENNGSENEDEASLLREHKSEMERALKELEKNKRDLSFALRESSDELRKTFESEWQRMVDDHERVMKTMMEKLCVVIERREKLVESIETETETRLAAVRLQYGVPEDKDEELSFATSFEEWSEEGGVTSGMMLAEGFKKGGGVMAEMATMRRSPLGRLWMMMVVVMVVMMVMVVVVVQQASALASLSERGGGGDAGGGLEDDVAPSAMWRMEGTTPSSSLDSWVGVNGGGSGSGNGSGSGSGNGSGSGSGNGRGSGHGRGSGGSGSSGDNDSGSGSGSGSSSGSSSGDSDSDSDSNSASSGTTFTPAPSSTSSRTAAVLAPSPESKLSFSDPSEFSGVITLDGISEDDINDDFRNALIESLAFEMGIDPADIELLPDDEGGRRLDRRRNRKRKEHRRRLLSISKSFRFRVKTKTSAAALSLKNKYVASVQSNKFDDTLKQALNNNTSNTFSAPSFSARVGAANDGLSNSFQNDLQNEQQNEQQNEHLHLHLPVLLSATPNLLVVSVNNSVVSLSVNASSLQKKIQSACAPGTSMQRILDDGSVVCTSHLTLFQELQASIDALRENFLNINNSSSSRRVGSGSSSGVGDASRSTGMQLAPAPSSALITSLSDGSASTHPASSSTPSPSSSATLKLLTPSGSTASSISSSSSSSTSSFTSSATALDPIVWSTLQTSVNHTMLLFSELESSVSMLTSSTLKDKVKHEAATMALRTKTYHNMSLIKSQFVHLITSLEQTTQHNSSQTRDSIALLSERTRILEEDVAAHVRTNTSMMLVGHGQRLTKVEIGMAEKASDEEFKITQNVVNEMKVNLTRLSERHSLILMNGAGDTRSKNDVQLLNQTMQQQASVSESRLDTQEFLMEQVSTSLTNVSSRLTSIETSVQIRAVKTVVDHSISVLSSGVAMLRK